MNYGLIQVLLRDRLAIRPTMVLHHQCKAQGLCLAEDTNNVRTEYRAAYFSSIIQSYLCCMAASVPKCCHVPTALNWFPAVHTGVCCPGCDQAATG